MYYWQAQDEVRNLTGRQHCGCKDAVRRAAAAAKENTPNKNRLADRPKIPHLCKSPLLSAIYPEYPFMCGAQTDDFS